MSVIRHPFQPDVNPKWCRRCSFGERIHPKTELTREQKDKLLAHVQKHGRDNE